MIERYLDTSNALRVVFYLWTSAMNRPQKMLKRIRCYSKKDLIR